MTCVHRVKWSVKRPEDCRFRLSVSHYKDRIVAPDEYSGATEVTPSHIEQVLPTTDKLVRDDITIFPAPTEYLSTDHNGTFTPSDGKVGFYQVDVDVNPDLRPLSVSENGTYEPDGFDGYSQVSVDVPSEVTFDGIADGTQPSGDITLTVTEVVAGAFRDKTAITGISAPNCTTVQNQGFIGCSGVTEVYLPKLETVGNNGFTNIKATNIVLPAIKTTGSGAFASSAMVRHMCIGEHIETIGASCMNNMSAGWSVKIKGKPTSIATTAFPSNSTGDIYVPWSEGEVANAPWGATSATIHYDTVYDSEWNVISST